MNEQAEHFFERDQKSNEKMNAYCALLFHKGRC